MLCLLFLNYILLLRVVPSHSAGHHELRRELAAMKEIVENVERKVDSMVISDTGRKFHTLESTLNTLLNKVSDINRKSQLLSEIHQDNDARKEILQRMSRTIEEISRKQILSKEKKTETGKEPIEKLSENVQALFQIFGGMNRKLDDLQTRIERITSACPTNDLKFFITKKIDSLTASTSLLSECIECDRESLKDVLLSFVRHPLENVAKKCSQGERSILDTKWKSLLDTLQSTLHYQMESFGTKFEAAIHNMNCGGDRMSRFTAAHDIPYSHDTPQDLRVSSKTEDGSTQKETPGRIFRKLWRKMTEPINKVGEKIESLAQTLEASNERHHNETLMKLREWSGKRGGDSCGKQLQVIQNTTKETAQMLENIESKQQSVQNVCAKILSEVERVRSTLKIVDSTFVPGVTEAYHEKSFEGYLGASCSDIQSQGLTRNGVYSLKPKDSSETFLAYCDLETEGGGWTVLQRRGDFGDEFRQNFTQNWDLYKRGFGDLQSEFWIGNEKIFLLTTQEDVKLRVELEDFDGHIAYAEYSRFRVEDESKQYRLSIGEYEGNATDSLSLHDGKMFSTYDRDNDEVSSCCNCADTFKGGWWYYRCFEANLNGPYHTDPTENGYFLGIIWEKWRGDYSLKSSEMKIRPISFDDGIVDP